VQVCTVVGNCPGFVGNRMLFPYKAETDFLIEEGASPYAVDKYDTIHHHTHKQDSPWHDHPCLADERRCMRMQ
jgi:hypothetical protein